MVNLGVSESLSSLLNSDDFSTIGSTLGSSIGFDSIIIFSSTLGATFSITSETGSLIGAITIGSVIISTAGSAIFSEGCSTVFEVLTSIGFSYLFDKPDFTTTISSS